MKFPRRSFMALASGLLVPWERERVYSFARPRSYPYIVFVSLTGGTIGGIQFPACVAQMASRNSIAVGELVGMSDDDQTVTTGRALAIGRVVKGWRVS
jgi:hypothetical protein